MPTSACKSDRWHPIRTKLVKKALRIAGSQASDDQCVPGVQIFVREAPTRPASKIYSPGLGIILQGRKRIVMGNKVYRCDEAQMILTSAEFPVMAEVTEASPKRPYCAMLLKIDIEEVRELIAELDSQECRDLQPSHALATGPTSPELLSAFDRLLDLHGKPKDAAVLGRLIHREILYRLLTSQQGIRLREIASRGTSSDRIAQAMRWIQQNYKKQIRIEDLARMTGMGLSTFHHHFRAMSAISPLQYQKQLRLHEAKRLITHGDFDTTSVAMEVGYESTTQFIREYGRVFGMSPRRHARFLLET